MIQGWLVTFVVARSYYYYFTATTAIIGNQLVNILRAGIIFIRKIFERHKGDWESWLAGQREVKGRFNK